MEQLTLVCVSDAFWDELHKKYNDKHDEYQQVIKDLWNDPKKIRDISKEHKEVIIAGPLAPWLYLPLFFVDNIFHDGIVYVSTEDANNAFQEAYCNDFIDGEYYVVHPRDKKILIPAEKFLSYIEEEKTKEIINYICETRKPKHITIIKHKLASTSEKVTLKTNVIDTEDSKEFSDSVKVLFDMEIKDFKIDNLNYHWMNDYNLLCYTISKKNSFELGVDDDKNYKFDSKINLKKLKLSVFAGYNKTYKVSEKLQVKVKY